jgi:hypothetical protein
MQRSFDGLCRYLAREGGGYTLWVGAGASIAASKGATPGWDKLVKDIATAHQIALPLSDDMPSQLEVLSDKIGHAAFRKELRTRLIAPISVERLDFDVLVQQAIIGARASAVVSFNIDLITGVAFACGRPGGSTPPRTYLDRHEYVGATISPAPGPLASPVYCPHGLLDVYGNCVMTRSEYLKHKMSLAVGTAVQMCLGGDLLILGMSISDSYIQEALLAGRRWIRDIYWLCDECPHPEWARVADVTVIRVEHARLWTEMSACHIAADQGGSLAKIASHLNVNLKSQLLPMLNRIHGLQADLNQAAATAVAIPLYDTEKFMEFARHCVDLGLEVPDVMKQDGRYAGG